MVLPRSVARRLALAAVAVLVGLVALAGAEAQGGGATTTVEVRVWQHVEDGRNIHVNARAVGGAWAGLTAMPLDDGFSSSGRFRFGDVAFEVPLAGRATPATVEVRVWQDVRDDARIHISMRPAGGSWSLSALALDDGFNRRRTFQFGDISLEVPLPPEEVSTLAGSPGEWGYRNATGEDVRFGAWFGQGALGLAVDLDGSIIIADRWNNAIRRMTPEGVVTTVAGGGGSGLEDGLGEAARFDSPRGVVVAGDGAIYVADTGNYRIRKIAPDGMVTTVAGSDHEGQGSRELRDGPAMDALFERPGALALDPFGDLLIADRYAVRRLSPSGWVSTVAGGAGLGWRDGSAEHAQFRSLQDIALDDAGNLYVLDSRRGTIGSGGTVVAVRKIDVDGNVTTLYRDGYPSLGATLADPLGIAVTGDGTIYLANSGRHQIVRLTAEGELRAVAGTGEKGYLEGPREAATFSTPLRMALAPDGVLFVADQGGAVIRRVELARSGEAEAIPLAVHEPLPRVAGVRARVFVGEGGQGLVDGQGMSARFLFPAGMVLDGSGNLIVADSGNQAIRHVAPDGTVTTLAGGNGRGILDGPCREAQFVRPEGVAISADGTIYISDNGANRIRTIDADCMVATVAGSGPASSREEGWGGFRDGPAAEAMFHQPSEIAFDNAGNLFIADTYNNLIRRLSPDGQVATVAGSPALAAGRNHGSRDGQGTEAQFHFPTGITVDGEGNVLFTDANDAIRKIDGQGFVSTLLKTVDSREGGALAGYNTSLAVGLEGELYIADGGFGRVLRLSPDGVLSIVADAEHVEGLWEFDSRAIVVAPEGTLFVSDYHGGVIWKITFEDEAPE